MKPCENCGHVERSHFICPACGVSFEVRSEQSTRIFCSHECICIDREAHRAAAHVQRRSEANAKFGDLAKTPRNRLGSRSLLDFAGGGDTT